ncbi:MAG TPA: type II toxin-antitoxin system RelE/ParE family toxin [Caulobacterales bacterium]|nr:type II toxin-antitoxin system RelE/ParE family toxin [Caulobacterales bacterium]
MAGFSYTERAKRELADIWNYTDETWGREQADHYVREIDNLVALAVTRRSLLRSRPDLGDRLFALGVGSHLAFLEEQAGGDFLVIAVLHQRMDAKTRLSDE